jgi:hypothetical protein
LLAASGPRTMKTREVITTRETNSTNGSLLMNIIFLILYETEKRGKCFRKKTGAGVREPLDPRILQTANIFSENADKENNAALLW